MDAKLHTLWQRLRQPLAVVGIVVVCSLGIALIVMIIGGYLFYWNWTGITTTAAFLKGGNKRGDGHGGDPS